MNGIEKAIIYFKDAIGRVTKSLWIDEPDITKQTAECLEPKEENDGR